MASRSFARLAAGLGLLAVFIAPLVAPLAPALASAQSTAPGNTTAPGYGLVLALEASVNRTAMLLKQWGIPSNSTLWQKLEKVNESIQKVAQLVEEGDMAAATHMAAKLFRELGMIVREAAAHRQVAKAAQAPGEQRARLAAELARMEALERALMRGLQAIMGEANNTIAWAMRHAGMPNCTPMLGQLKAVVPNATALMEKLKSMLNETTMLRSELASGNVSVQQLANYTKQLEKQLRLMERMVSSLGFKVRASAASLRACAETKFIDRFMERLEKRIMNMTQLAEKLRSEGKIRAAEAIMRHVHMIEEMMEKYKEMIEHGLHGGHGFEEALQLIQIRHMMPLIDRIVEKVIAQRLGLVHIISVARVEEVTLHVAIATRELQAVGTIVPSSAKQAYEQAVAAMQGLEATLNAYAAGKASPAEVATAAQHAIDALQQLRQAVSKAAAKPSTPPHQAPGNTTATPPARGGKGRNTTTTTSQQLPVPLPMPKPRNIIGEAEKAVLERVIGHCLGAAREALHLAESAEHMKTPLNTTVPKLAYHAEYMVLHDAERMIGAAATLARIAGNSTLAAQLSEMEASVSKAISYIASGNLSAAEALLNQTLAQLQTVKLPVAGWLQAKIDAFAARAAQLIQVALMGLQQA